MSDHDCSSSDSDTGVKEAMEALNRAFSVTGVDRDQLKSSLDDVDSDSAYDSADEDIQRLHSIRERFSIPDDDNGIELKPISMKPLRTILPPGFLEDNDNYEEDFETLQAVQRRFYQYDGIMNMDMENSVQRSEQVGATNNIDLGEESSSNSFVKRNNNGQGFADCVDGAGNNQNSDISKVSEGHEPGSELVPVTDSFPKSAQAFVEAIKKNRMCQKLIRDKLGHIDARMEENRKLRERVKILKDFQTACRKRTGRALSQKRDPRIQLISTPKPRANASKVKDKNTHAIYQGPAENSHVVHYRDAMSKYPFSLSREPWSKEEKKKLSKGITQQFKKKMYFLNLGDINVNEKIRHLKPSSEEIKLFSKDMWDQLASHSLPGRSGPECESRWRNCEDSSINHGPWTITEDKKLLHIISNRGVCDWINIAEELNTNRTPFQCLSRFQRSLNTQMIKNEWSPDEDDELRKAVAEHGETNWQLVASALEGRTGTQCSNRWKKSLNPLRERVGKWDPDEDKRLKIAVRLFGAKNWNKIAKFVPGRTQVQCRERWVNCLDPCLNMNEWTEDEDSKLKKTIEEHGHCWSKIAAAIPPRTDSQCLRRWKMLFPDQVRSLQVARKVRRTALVSNFVDREGERPALSAKDFNLPLWTELDPNANEDHNKKKKRSITGKRSRRARKVNSAKIVSVSTDENDLAENNDHVDIATHDVAVDREANKKATGKLKTNQRAVPEIRSRRARRVTHTEKALVLVDEDENDGHAEIMDEESVEKIRRIDNCEIEKKASRKRKRNQRDKEVEEMGGCISKKPRKKNGINERLFRNRGSASADERSRATGIEKGGAELKVYFRRRYRKHNNESGYINPQMCSSSRMSRKQSEDILGDEETFGSFLMKLKKRRRNRVMVEKE